jgi:arylsulfatase A-like enzyme
MIGLAHGSHGWDIHDSETHLASHLKAAGYHTSLIGFQHETRRPEEMGYDQCDYRWHDSCENISRDAAAVIAACARNSQPYYLQVGMIEPHRHFDMYGARPDDSLGVWIPPYLTDEESAAEDFAGYQGAIRKMDASVGTIIGAVEASEAADNTLLIFTTDHGIPFPRAKCSLYDAGLRTAMIARWPAGGWTDGRVIDGNVSNVDIMPSLLQIVGGQAPADVSGISFMGPSGGPADIAPRRDFVFGEMTYHDYYDPMRCVGDGRYKLIANVSTAPYVHDPSQAWRPLTTPLPRHASVGSHPDFEFYDLDSDPHQLTDLYGTDSVLPDQNRLLAELAGWCVRTDDTLVTEPPRNPQHRRVRDVLMNASGSGELS